MKNRGKREAFQRMAKGLVPVKREGTKKIKLLQAATIDGTEHAAGAEIELPAETADALIAAQQAELVEVKDEDPKKTEPTKPDTTPTVREVTKNIIIHTGKNGTQNKDEKNVAMFSRETVKAKMFGEKGAVGEYVHREGIADIFAALRANTAYGKVQVMDADQGLFQEILDIDPTELATWATGCPVPEGGAPVIWSQRLGKIGSRVPLCQDDLEDNTRLAGALKTALNLRLILGVGEGIFTGAYDNIQGGLMGLYHAQTIQSGAVKEVNVTGATTPDNVLQRLNTVLASTFLPLQPYMSLGFGSNAWASFMAAMQSNGAKCCTWDSAGKRIDTHGYDLSASMPADSIVAYFAPSYVIRLRRGLTLENCGECGNHTEQFTVSARMTGRMTGIGTAAILKIA